MCTQNWYSTTGVMLVYISWRFVSSQTVCKKKYAFCAWLVTIRIVVFMPSSLYYWHWFALSSVFHHATTVEWWASFKMFHNKISMSLNSSFLSKVSHCCIAILVRNKENLVKNEVGQFWQYIGVDWYGNSRVRLLCIQLL